MAAASDILHLNAGRLTADIAPGTGGSIAALRIDGKDVLRPLSQDDRARRNVLGAASFPMIPFANRIGGNAFTFEGRTIRFQPNNPPEIYHVHGTGWQRPWQVAAAGGAHTTLTLSERSIGSYSYDAVQEFHLDGTQLSLTTRLTNTGAFRMPFGLGHHPWFPREAGATLHFNAGTFHLNEPELMIGKRIALPPELSFAQARSLPDFWLCSDFGGWDGHATIKLPQRGAGLTLHGDGLFTHLMIYADPKADVFCVEPQTNASCAFNRPGGFEDEHDNVVILAPGESMCATLRLEPFTL